MDCLIHKDYIQHAKLTAENNKQHLVKEQLVTLNIITRRLRSWKRLRSKTWDHQKNETP